MYTYDQTDQQASRQTNLNTIFTWVFFVEMICKITGLGFSSYWANSYNRFDSIVVILSFIDWIGGKTSLETGDSFLKAFRTFRLLRMIELARAWDALNEIWLKTVKSFMDIGNFSLLMLLFIYIFALLGMELFSNIALVDEYDNLVVGEDRVQQLYSSGEYYTFPRDNFNSLGFAITSVFIVFIGEDWNWTMYQWIRAYGNGSPTS